MQHVFKVNINKAYQVSVEQQVASSFPAARIKHILASKLVTQMS